ncbi:MAG: hypothetical protein KDA24_29140, partial [Deltaproteobacteria bacterium]|nr:hypothetical protein [Deltaproteobacteria bacterium]
AVGCPSEPAEPVLETRALLAPRAEVAICAPLDGDTFAADLRATACFPDGPAADLIPYDVRSPLWTDGALKRRWMTVPPGEVVGYSATGDWLFPQGSTLIKQFLAAPDVPIETRFMVRDGDGWMFASYQHDGEEAPLLHTFDVADIALGENTVRWYFPDADGCRTCHTGGALGPVAAQLDTDYDYAGEVRSQLDELARIGVFDVSAPTAAAPLPDPADDTESLEDRARSWLHANCAHCHRPGGWTPPEMTMDLRFTTPLPSARVCGEPVQFDQAPDAGAFRIAPGASSDSAIWGRITADGLDRMPPIGTTLLDPVSVQTVQAWIDSLEGCPGD